MAADYQLELRDYLSIARRWAIPMILTFGFVLAASVVVSLLLPRVYEATAIMLAEGPRISGEVVQSTVSSTPDRRIQSLHFRVMTRDNLLKIAREHRVFRDKEGVPLKEHEVVDLMRKGLQLNLHADMSMQRADATISFSLGFQHGQPDKAYEVTNALVQLLLVSSAQDRLQQATRTTDFLGQEAQRLREQLAEYENRIATFKRQQGGALSENLAANFASIQTLEIDMRQAEREQRAALDEIRSLEVELSGLRSGVIASTTAPPALAMPSAAETELDRARTELAQLRGTYTEDHPDVRALVRRVATLQETVAREPQTETPGRVAAAAQSRHEIARVEARIATARARADLLGSQHAQLRSTVGQLRGQLQRAPQAEQQLAELQRDYAAAQVKYDDLRSKLLSAEVAVNLEDDQQGERISLLEPALMPEYPIKPSRKKLVLLGFMLAMVVAGAVAFVLETLFGRVRGVNAVTALTGQRPLVTIPYIVTSAEVRASQVLRKQISWAVAGFLLLLVVTVHYFFLPLPELLIQLFAHLG